MLLWRVWSTTKSLCHGARDQNHYTKPPGFVEAELEVGFKMFVERCASLLHCFAWCTSSGTA